MFTILINRRKFFIRWLAIYVEFRRSENAAYFRTSAKLKQKGLIKSSYLCFDKTNKLIAKSLRSYYSGSNDIT